MDKQNCDLFIQSNRTGLKKKSQYTQYMNLKISWEKEDRHRRVHNI